MGAHKGCTKAPGTGRKKGDRNIATKMREELNNPLTTQEQIKVIRDILFEMGKKGSILAARVWLESLEKGHILEDLKLNIKSFETIEQGCQKIIEEMCAGRLSLTQGKAIIDILHVSYAFKEGKAKDDMLAALKQVTKKE